DAAISTRMSFWNSFHMLARGWTVIGKSLEAQQQYAEAADRYLDLADAATRTSHGGTWIDDGVGMRISSYGLVGLASILDKLDEQALAVVAERLPKISKAHDPLEEVLEHERVFGSLVYGWSGRAYAFYERLSGAMNEVEEAAAVLRQENDARIHLLIA